MTIKQNAPDSPGTGAGTGPVLLVEKIKKSFRHHTGDIQVLRGLDLAVVAGETVAITGPSGSGKSTLLSMLAGLDTPDEGSISYGDTEITRLNEEARTAVRAGHLGIIFQQFHLMPHMSALENVALPLEIAGMDHARERAAAALAEVGLGARLGHRPAELSGGECQRVAIARAMVTGPRMILADEPSGNLDAETGRQVMELLFHLVTAHRTAVVLVTHNPELASRCSRHLFLHQGILENAPAH